MLTTIAALNRGCQSEPMNVETENLCPACDTGHLQAKTIDYPVTVSGDVKVIVRNLAVEVCEACGEVVLSADALDAVDAAIAEQTEQLTVRELERIREDLDVDQTEMSEILGLGGKTYHRWEKGNQVPSRSMGYYLRTLAEFPEAFTWLRDRGWQRRNRLAAKAGQFDFSAAFPHLATTQHVPAAREVPRFNPAKALFGKAA